VEEDIGQAEDWYLKAAERGDVHAQLSLGRIYKNNQNLTDVNKSIEWYEEAYYNGASGASAVLRFLYDPHSKTDVSDLENAIEWSYREDDTYATSVLLRRHPIYKTFKSTIKALFRSCVYQERVLAFVNLAKKCKKEFRPPLYRRAAALGSSRGLFYYARDLPDNHPKKLKLLRRSAEDDGTPAAQWLLGVFYEAGRCGLQKNPIVAKEWKDKAVAGGYKPPS
jgi:TPR repeat protein